MKNYLIKLKNIFAFRNIRNQGFYLLLFIISLIYLIVKEAYFISVLIVILLILFLMYNKTLLYYSIICGLIVIIYLGINSFNFNNTINDIINDYGKIYKVISYDDYDKVYVSIGKNNYIFNISDEHFSAGDVIYIDGSLKKISKAHYDNGFDYANYLRYQNIKGLIQVEDVVLIKHQFGINIFHESVNDYIKKHFEPSNAQIIQALIIGEKHNLNDELYNQIQKIGISHLFVISGLHIELINKVVDKFLSFIHLKANFKNFIILMVLFFYYILTSFLVSILRVIISFMFNKIFKKQTSVFSAIDKLSLNAVIVLLINPFNLFSYSFLLSYMIVFGILLISPKLKKEKGVKSFIYNNLFISFTSTLISLPIVISISSDINLLTISFNLFFIPFVSYILLPCSFITFIIPPLECIYKYIVNMFINLITFLSKFDLLTISFAFIPLILIIIFYLFFFLIFNNKVFKYKKIICSAFVLYLVLLFYLPFFNPTSEVSFLDLPKGDATFIHAGYNKTNILIDTGDVDASMLVSFLKSKGVKKLDAVIISHGDSDHIGGLKSLINEFRIDRLFISYYDSVSVNEISNYHLSNTEVYYLKEGDEFYINKLYFKVLWPSSNQFDVNNNSLVIYSVIFETSFLFTGDIEKEAESDFIKKYKNISVDVLKVAHHGSKTSSTLEFLKCVNFKYAVAMNGYINTYDFPNKIVVDRINSLESSMMLNTIDYGKITFYKKFKNRPLKISTSFKN